MPFRLGLLSQALLHLPLITLAAKLYVYQQLAPNMSYTLCTFIPPKSSHSTSHTPSKILLTPLPFPSLVSVVQLCSYLIKRQHRAMDLYLNT